MKKIVMLSRPIHPVPPKKGAAVEWWMVQVSKRLTSCRPHIISIGGNNYPKNETIDGIYHHRIEIGRFYKRVFNKWLGLDPYSYAKRAADIIEDIKPDIVHFHNAHDLIPDVTLQLFDKPKVISHFHNDFPVKNLNGADMVITCSNFLKSIYSERFHGRVDIKTALNGVDTDIFHTRLKNSMESLSLKNKLGIPQSGKVVLYAGRIVHEKGPHLLINAFAALLREIKDIYLVLVGEVRTRGRENDNRAVYGRQISEKCRALGERVKLVGAIPPQEMHFFYSIADIAVVPSVFEEPFGMVAIEAMACGVPVLASNKGGLKEYIIDGVNGLFIAENKPAEGIAEGIKTLIHDEILRETIGKAGRKTAVERFSWEKIVYNLENVYSELLS